MLKIDDHSLQLQWDSSEIDRGFKELERKFSKLDHQFSLNPKTRRDESGDTRTRASTRAGTISDVARLKQEEQIARARLEAETKIANLKKIGSKESQRAVAELEREVSRLNLAKQSLDKSTRRADKSFLHYNKQLSTARLNIRKLSQGTKGLTREFNAQKFATTGLTQSLKNLGRSYISVFAAIAGAGGVLRTVRSFEDMSSTLLLASGSSEQAAKDFQFLSGLAVKLGLDINSTSRAYAKFAVAGARLEQEGGNIKKTFEDISVAIRATGLEKQRADLAFLAFQQMLAGQVIQGQEYNQIIEQMPQFTKLATDAARELGYEFDNIKELIATGTLQSTSFVSKVGELMKKQAVDTGAYAKSINSITAQTARLQTALDLNIVAGGEAGFREGFAEFLKALTDSVKKLKPLFVSIGGTLGNIFKILGGILHVLNIATSPIFIAIDAMNDLNKATQSFFSSIIDGNAELKEGEYILNGWKRMWMWILGYVLRVKGHIKMFIGDLQAMISSVLDSKDPFAFFKIFFEDTDIGSKYQKDKKADILAGERQAKLQQGSNTTINNEYNINGDPEMIKEAVDEGVSRYMQNIYSLGG